MKENEISTYFTHRIEGYLDNNNVSTESYTFVIIY